jgi:hypothetical protein
VNAKGLDVETFRFSQYRKSVFMVFYQGYLHPCKPGSKPSSQQAPRRMALCGIFYVFPESGCRARIFHHNS